MCDEEASMGSTYQEFEVEVLSWGKHHIGIVDVLELVEHDENVV